VLPTVPRGLFTHCHPFHLWCYSPFWDLASLRRCLHPLFSALLTTLASPPSIMQPSAQYLTHRFGWTIACVSHLWTFPCLWHWCQRLASAGESSRKTRSFKCKVQIV